MPLTPPAAVDFKARYPEFQAVPDALVNLVLGESVGSVDETWREGDRSPAILALAAHTLAMEGEPNRSSGGSSSAATGPLKRVKVGDVETEFQDAAKIGGASSQGDHGLTAYGRRFLELRARNFPTFTVI